MASDNLHPRNGQIGDVTKNKLAINSSLIQISNSKV